MLDSDLSSMFGWVSIACWVVVYSPQIYENYSLQSGEGLSVLFVLVWLLGDFCNLLGAVLANLLPTVVLLGIYYTLCDLILLGQIYYYRRKRSYIALRREEQEPFLSTRRNEQPTEHTSAIMVITRYACATCFVVVVGVVAWWLSRSNQSISEPERPPMAPDWFIQSLGWTGAVSYLGARVPQIFKNFKTRCEGLSPALFFFAILGNITYALSICAKSMDQEYLMLNASWLAGSILTVFLDVLVIVQLFYYRTVDHMSVTVFI